MRYNNLIQTSIHIVQSYCHSDLKPFFQHIDEDTIWVGPREGQVMRSKEQIMSAWTENALSVSCNISDMEAYALSAGSSCCEVLLDYRVHATVNGKEINHKQIAQFSWVRKNETAEDGTKKKVFRIFFMHLSNPAPPDERDIVYRVFGNIPRANYTFETKKAVNAPRVTIRGTNGVMYNYLVSSIIWIESDADSRRSIIHTQDRVIHCHDRIKLFKEEYKDYFLRAHVSYLVNPIYVKDIRRFEVTLWDGTTLPIPEKKYTSFKNAFLEFQKNCEDNQTDKKGKK